MHILYIYEKQSWSSLSANTLAQNISRPSMNTCLIDILLSNYGWAFNKFENVWTDQTSLITMVVKTLPNKMGFGWLKYWNSSELLILILSLVGNKGVTIHQCIVMHQYFVTTIRIDSADPIYRDSHETIHAIVVVSGSSDAVQECSDLGRPKWVRKGSGMLGIWDVTAWGGRFEVVFLWSWKWTDVPC